MIYRKGIIAGQKVLLAKPLTYMNLSSKAIRALADYYKIDPETELIVFYDDISLAPGQLHIRKKVCNKNGNLSRHMLCIGNLF